MILREQEENPARGTVVCGKGSHWGTLPPATDTYVLTASSNDPSGTGLTWAAAMGAGCMINFGTQGGTVANPTPQVLWTFQPTDTTKGPWQLICHDALFGTTQDSVLSIGYNTSPAGTSTVGTAIIASEPMFHMNLEQDYWNVGTSSYCCEWYVEFIAAGGSTQWRPIGFSLNRATAAANVGSEIGPSGDPHYGQFQVTSNGAGLFTVTPSQVTCNINTLVQGTLHQTLAGATNGVTCYAFQANIGTDATLGPLLVGMGGIPSSTGSSRKGLIWVGDNAAARTLCLNSSNGTSYGPVSSGPLTVEGAITSSGEINGPVAPIYAANATTYTATAQDCLLAVSAASPWTLTLPAANSVKPGHEYIIKKTDNNSNLITVAASGSDEIDGAASYTNLAAQYKYLRINSDGVGNWLITGSN